MEECQLFQHRCGMEERASQAPSELNFDCVMNSIYHHWRACREMDCHSAIKFISKDVENLKWAKAGAKFILTSLSILLTTNYFGIGISQGLYSSNEPRGWWEGFEE
ncbi:hypothetical protein IFM89_018708 [Coptis chinensis]|uniref:Uncharacterized protein n=1 Tax=Coptis chinensis TaxID=261450 RepID=A0A835HCM4_9MAGN|nr:hypothetical protein IFM89_018708 [Coptis chinensis]